MALYGYARCSLSSQSVASQVVQLKQAGCQRIFTDEGVSGAKSDRPGYRELLSVLKSGDTVIVYKLDRLARSTRDLLEKIDHLTQIGVRFQSITEHIDLDTAAGELLLHLLGSFAAFERSLLIERTKAGLHSARLAGKQIGRPPALSQQEIAQVKRRIGTGEPVSRIAQSMGVGRSTLYRYVQTAECD
ncbi:recombinase family protein [Ponticaulis koreensis]|uniref:recombinase family protein n=1 Tax=Ponticaulis koreensis TaxID=1123045 RepID=UPI0003B712C5|nr:recombinase family protein [Ponticaulis koreensis]